MSFLIFKMADAMEMMVLSILAPILLCEWNLQKYQEAMITTVCEFLKYFMQSIILLSECNKHL